MGATKSKQANHAVVAEQASSLTSLAGRTCQSGFRALALLVAFALKKLAFNASYSFQELTDLNQLQSKIVTLPGNKNPTLLRELTFNK